MIPLRAFIVEDSRVIAENLIEALQEMTDVTVVGTAADEQAATRWLCVHAASCDLVIIDIFLDSGSGLGVLRAAAELTEVPVLAVLTNYATGEIRRQCLALGADRVFDKSHELDQLIDYCAGLAAKRSGMHAPALPTDAGDRDDR